VRGARPAALSVLALVALAASGPAFADGAGVGSGPVLHEPIAPDPREDLAMRVSIDGELPAALRTPSGIVGAPDPRSLPSATDASYRPGTEHDVFVPDRDTRRPNVPGYDDPFTPGTAPFKRLEAFDAVRADYELYVRDDRLVPLAFGVPPANDEEEFYGDVVVDLESDARIRVPSVGPGAHIVRARLGVGTRDVSITVFRDGADNWFLQPRAPVGKTNTTTARARLVMEIAAPKGAFGGPIGDPAWSDLPFVPPLPDNVARDAALVRTAIGIGRALRPREVIGKLVHYFRSFTDSDDPPRGSRSLYLDLALSKKGVCRHRAFAFLVTAQSVGIPARLAMNEAHAWVEVHDGTSWRRIDLGGAGQMTTAARDPDRVPYEWPPDPFAWPQGAVRGDEMIADARGRPPAPGQGPSQAASAASVASAAATSAVQPPVATTAQSSAPSSQAVVSTSDRDDRPSSTVTLSISSISSIGSVGVGSAGRVGGGSSDARRGGPIEVHGTVRADRDACPHLAVELWLRGPNGAPAPTSSPARMLLVGTLATDDQGDFAGRVVVPASVTLGDYDVVARTAGDSRCGASAQ
jgi:transglutaminase-like putative cysteine protease